MRIQVKLMGTLRGKQPAGGTLDVEPGTTVVAALEGLGVDGGHVHLVMVNGAMELDRGRILADGDELLVFPPVAGGAIAEEPRVDLRSPVWLWLTVSLVHLALWSALDVVFWRSCRACSG